MSGSGNTSDSRRGRTIWTFGAVELDESRWSLRVDGHRIDLEQKPMEILLELLHRAGEVVTKAELLESVWAGVIVVEASLPTAIGKLRKALGDHGDMIETVPRIGYRIASTVVVERNRAPEHARMGFVIGQPVPGREDWIFERRLSKGDSDDVWLARASNSEMCRVFKFAETPARLRALKREAALSGLLYNALGARLDFVAVTDRNFEHAPYFAAFDYGGPDLVEWFARSGNEASRPDRLRIVEQAARSIGAAHGVGILHKDLKPTNLLVEDVSGGQTVRIVDFGSGALIDEGLSTLHHITGLTMPESNGDTPLSSSQRSGTLLYMAPELIGGAAPSIASDIYALGMILFQLIVGDLNHPLAPGWEQMVPDPLLRDDIAQASAVDPAKRFATADMLADRLATLEIRRGLADRAAVERLQIAEFRRAAERGRARRPWVLAAGAILTTGLVTTSIATWQAIAQRDIARRQASIAASINSFLADDLLARGDPSKGDAANETLIAAVRRAEPEIARRFGNEPLIAARLYHTLARVYDQRSEWQAARLDYDHTDEQFRRAGAAGGKEAVIARLQRASMEALSFEKGSVERAKRILASVGADSKGVIDTETAVWKSSAQGMVGLAGGDVRVARDSYARAAALADALPGVFDARARNNFHQRHAFTFLRLGDGAGAEAALKPLLARQAALLGPQHPDVLLVRLNLGQAYLLQRRYPAAVDELSAILPALTTRLGPEHRLTLQTLAARQQALGSMGRYREAIADGAILYRNAVAKQGLRSFTSIAALTDIATSECRGPDLAGGTVHAKQAYDASRSAFGTDAPLTGATALTLAQCLIENGQHELAAPLLPSIDRKAVGELAGDPAWGANIDLAQAEIALHSNRDADARSLWQAASTIYSRPDADPFQHRKLLALKNRLSL